MEGGLVYHHASSRKVVPLKSIAVKVLVRGFVADVKASMVYRNDEAFPIEPSFFFPLDDDSAVHAFRARIADREMSAALKEKMEAEDEYDDAIAMGRRAFRLSKECGDVFHCMLGNLGAGEEAELSLEFVSELGVEADGAVRFCLPTVLNPRYSLQGMADRVSYLAPSQDVPYTLSFTLTAENPGGIRDVSSPSGLLGPAAFAESDRASAQVSLEGDFKFDQDIEVLIYYEQKHQPFALIEPGLPATEVSFLADTVAMLNFYPGEMEEMEVPTAEHGEFIFIIDCSGSMNNNPIMNAKETLILLLKSLPLGCLFNIYSFGSRFRSLYTESMPYDQQTMDTALKHVCGMDANMGGTNIMGPLVDICKQPCKPQHPRKLFLLTDGMVDNTQGVIQTVKHHSMDHRCFAFGIGQSVSTELIKQVAHAGKGLSEFVTSSDRLQAKVLRMLKCAMQPSLNNPQLEWTLPPGIVATVVPQLPESIFIGEKTIVYAQFTGTLPADPWQGTAVLKYSLCGKPIENRIVFSSKPADHNARLVLHRLLAKALIRHLVGDLGDDPSAAGPSDDARQRSVAVSLQAGVVSRYTVFVAVDTSPQSPIAEAMQARPVPRPHPHAPMVYHVARDAVPVDFSHHRHGAWMGFGAQSKKTSQQHQLQAAESGYGSGASTRSSSPTQEMSTSSARESQRRSHRVFQAQISNMTVEKKYRQGSQQMWQTPSRSNSTTSPYCVEMSHLVHLQQANGSWESLEQLAVALQIPIKTLQSEAPQDMASEVWATVLALVWLQYRAAEQKLEWDLLSRKASLWLGLQGIDIAAAVEAANKALGSSVKPSDICVARNSSMQ
ncbi:von Willebrand factor A domain-containing protein 5A-like [Lethenteron reissneri]|uniref:von Willebrand factor A domain-containing protein 5A-like n=1 Tax=Lethenteron reissneri TaxID=7753 RepID=UPI002AB7003F|nr:von Willebrand factor A domain-containing protein 5A-like [Lethenteron reissneri]XP_061431424.1 von Willebrand factor A domain-containing protein 5A-like [Lethenteron reissneri]XP_061431425.1 von Willebrand factor A domain-containing protein 5A-like [Lethenteron reissneri]XP_061431426.1 von Willebrand factor A domain-containing protein 5A-like [Lethenteron reissneri]XP_061431428.1 von Willebrand factor A domain-containing protein 5A-like [Lethenteron reissneri]XP_061431429.1 von Willebrand 